MQKPILLTGLVILLLTAACSTTEKSMKYRLWYDKPAEVWEDALPIGNGRLGAMVFGRTTLERIQLNEDSIWPGGPEWGNPGGTRDDLAEIRQFLIAGDNVRADETLVDKFSRKSVIRSHQTLGDLFVDLGHKNITDYQRELDLNKALVTVSYKSNGDLVKERIFSSAVHNALIMEYTTEAKGGLCGKIQLSRPQDEGHPTVITRSEENNVLVMSGEATQRRGKIDSKPAPLLHGVKFETRLLVRNDGGEIVAADSLLILKNVKRAVFILVANTSFYNEDYSESGRKQLALLKDVNFDVMLNEHEKDYGKFFKRVELRLGDTAPDTVTTDKRLARVKNGGTDLHLESLLFQYGRYLLISCSRTGTNPANLQGLWNKHIKAPWNADYHLNINLQMNYWPAEAVNLSEMHLPLFAFIDKLIENGKITARQNFGCRGAVMPHATDCWAPTWLRAETAYWGGWIGSGGWLMRHLWEHYKFTADTVFLEKRVYPAISEIASFYADWIIEDPRDGLLVSVPSASPENRFINSRGQKVTTCLGSAIDQQIIKEVFENYINTCNVLQIDPPLLKQVKLKLSRLRSGLKIGKDGRILEWDREYEELEKGHRHMSHLYGFYPGNMISKTGTPELFAAVRKSIDFRLEHGGAGPGWSRAWLINFSARLLDGSMAHEHIQRLLSRSTGRNLFNIHPPFQIDGNFGFTAGVAEMLLQSHEGKVISLLPALPLVWKNGHVNGLKARGNYTVDIKWQDNKLISARITAGKGGKIILRYLDREVSVELGEGESYVLRN